MPRERGRLPSELASPGATKWPRKTDSFVRVFRRGHRVPPEWATRWRSFTFWKRLHCGYSVLFVSLGIQMTLQCGQRGLEMLQGVNDIKKTVKAVNALVGKLMHDENRQQSLKLKIPIKLKASKYMHSM